MMRWPLIRDIGLFLGGLTGVAHETILSKAERPTLLILFAAMMGLPAFLQPKGGAEDSALAQRLLEAELAERAAAATKAAEDAQAALSAVKAKP